MTCDENRIVAYVHGESSGADEQAFDEHLLSCEACWRAVQEDRLGRLATERLRAPAPLGLADKVTLSVDLAGRRTIDGDGVRGRNDRARRHSHDPRQRSPRRLVVAVALAVAVLGGTLGWTLADHQASDPPQIAGVVAMMSPKVASSEALRAGERFDIGGQPLTVRSYQVEGVVTLVATSARPFPTPAGSQLAVGSSSTAWMGTHGVFAMYGVNRPAGRGRESMFLIAAMPMARLPEVAARLHLI